MVTIISIFVLLNAFTVFGQDKIVIKYAFWGTPEQLRGTEEMIASFAQENPSIEVEVEVAAWGEYWTKLQVQTAGGVAPDVFLINAPSFVDYMRRGMLLDLTPFIEEDKFSMSGYPETLVQLYQDPESGAQYGMPRDFDTIAMFYNKKLFDEAGVSYPTDDWTYDDMIEAAEKLTKDTNNDGRLDQWGILASSALQQMVGPVIWANGGEVFNEDLTECLLEQPAAEEAIQQIYDWVNEKHIAPTPAQAESLGWAAFATGKLAMSFDGPFMIALYQDVESFQWDVAPLPIGSAGRATTLHGLANVVFSETKHPEAAWKLAKYLSQDNAQKYLADNNIAIPALTVYSSDFFEKLPYGNGESCEEVFLNAVNYARMFPIAPHYNEWDTEYLRTMELVLLGQTTPARALPRLSQQITRIINKP